MYCDKLMGYFALTRLVETKQATIYGKRNGALHGIAVISGQEKHNLMKQTRGWKQGVIHGVSMLPRNEMCKPNSLANPKGSKRCMSESSRTSPTE